MTQNKREDRMQIAPVPENRLSEEELAELDRLYEQFKKRLEEDSGDFPEFTGPGK